MTENHPTTPPPELVAAWLGEASDNEPLFPQVAAKAAQWGFDQANADIERKLQEAADQELEVCRQWLEINGAPCKFIDGLLAARRPKPPSLKEEALADLDASYERGYLKTMPYTNIRRALEQLPTHD